MLFQLRQTAGNTIPEDYRGPFCRAATIEYTSESLRRPSARPWPPSRRLPRCFPLRHSADPEAFRPGNRMSSLHPRVPALTLATSNSGQASRCIHHKKESKLSSSQNSLCGIHARPKCSLHVTDELIARMLTRKMESSDSLLQHWSLRGDLARRGE